jgi:cellulose synthase/poly-beta-1,6-N-acetylglucosamine synthase-like glycosyltransferase
MQKKVSIIIPVREINDYIRESIPYILKLDYSNYEVIIFPDTASDEKFDKTKIIPTGRIGPAEKRDLALKYAEGEILAFLDDDAYPRSDWLKNAARHFEDERIGAVGGPAVTPQNDNLLRQASGKVYESKLCSGNYAYRYIPGKLMEVDDFPSVNLIVRKDVFEQAGGFDSTYYPGEDTKLCLDITKKIGKRIIYDPEVYVWHHRRELFAQHMKQITNYALHRGYFAKTLPETSFRFSYFVPSLFLMGLVLGPIACLLIPFLWPAYFGVLGIYVLALLVSIINMKDIKLAFLTMAGIFITHIGYGFYFIKGLFLAKLVR